MNTESSDGQPFFGRAGALAVSAVVTVIIGIVVVGAFNAPDKADGKSEARDKEQQIDIDELRREIIVIGDSIGTEAVELERIRGQIASLEAEYSERWDRAKSDIARIESRIERMEEVKAQSNRIYRTE
jgi:hypothetical protein